jgi:hypothetical protein
MRPGRPRLYGHERADARRHSRTLFEVAALRDDAKHVSVREVELPVITLAEPLCRLHDLVEHRLQPLGPGNRAHHRPNGALLLAKILRLTKSLAYVW